MSPDAQRRSEAHAPARARTEHHARHLAPDCPDPSRAGVGHLSEPPTATGPINLPTMTGAIPVTEDRALTEGDHHHGPPALRITALVIVVLTTIGAIGPLATDMYLPAFPDVIQEFDTSAARLQLTLSAFFLGAAGGQIVAGPLSDRFGRRRPLLLGLLLCLVGSIGCALANGVDIMMLMRVLQGVGGGFGMVLGRAVLIDVVDGPELFRVLNVMQGISGLAPIIAPLLGGLVLVVAQWHAAFWIIAAMTALSLIGVLAVIPETLEVSRRHTGGMHAFARNVTQLLARPGFTIYLLVNAFSAFALMSYVSASAFVVQDVLGMSSIVFSTVFAMNSVGLMSMSFLSARLVRSIAPRVLIGCGLAAVLVGSLALLAGALAGGPPAWVVFPAFFLIVAAQGLVFGNGAAMAAREAADMAGTASALLGLGFSIAASAAAPLVGIAGTRSALPMAIATSVGALCSLALYAAAGRLTPERRA